VGQHEQSLSAVGTPGLLRCIAAPFRIVPHLGQRPENIGETQAKVPWDVLQHDPSRSHVANDSGNVRPEVPVIAPASAFAGETEWLAWVARRDEIHASTPRCAIECGEVIPHRSLVQGSFSHPGDEDAGSELVSLDPADGSQVWPYSAQPEFESADAGT